MNINTIAQMAGVSRATVSRYFNHGYVSEEKRQAIADVIKKTSFIPSRQAQSLRLGKTNLIGVILPKVNSYSVGRMLSGITNSLADTDYQLLLGNTNNDTKSELSYLQLFSQKSQVDGVILIATLFDQAHIEAIDALSCPLVVLGQNLKGYTSVYNDDYNSMFELTQKVVVHAHYPAYIGVTEDDECAGHLRHKAFLDACTKAEVEVPEIAQTVSAFTLDSGYLCAERILSAYPVTDALVCASDTIAFGAMACAREYGRVIPRDLAITGVGDTELTMVVTPTLTTIHHHYERAGKVAAQLLRQMIEDPSKKPESVCLSYELQMRNSTRV